MSSLFKSCRLKRISALGVCDNDKRKIDDNVKLETCKTCTWFEDNEVIDRIQIKVKEDLKRQKELQKYKKHRP